MNSWILSKNDENLDDYMEWRYYDIEKLDICRVGYCIKDQYYQIIIEIG